MSHKIVTNHYEIQFNRINVLLFMVHAFYAKITNLEPIKEKYALPNQEFD